MRNDSEIVTIQIPDERVTRIEFCNPHVSHRLDKNNLIFERTVVVGMKNNPTIYINLHEALMKGERVKLIVQEGNTAQTTFICEGVIKSIVGKAWSATFLAAEQELAALTARRMQGTVDRITLYNACHMLEFECTIFWCSYISQVGKLSYTL